MSRNGFKVKQQCTLSSSSSTRRDIIVHWPFVRAEDWHFVVVVVVVFFIRLLTVWFVKSSLKLQHVTMLGATYRQTCTASPLYTSWCVSQPNVNGFLWASELFGTASQRRNDWFMWPRKCHQQLALSFELQRVCVCVLCRVVFILFRKLS